jgi:hypothetical protein
MSRPPWEGPAVSKDRECGSKQGYLSKPKTKRFVRLMSAWHREGFHLYAWLHCGLYHVGHIVPAFLRALTLDAWTARRRMPAWA